MDLIKCFFEKISLSDLQILSFNTFISTVFSFSVITDPHDPKKGTSIFAQCIIQTKEKKDLHFYEKTRNVATDANINIFSTLLNIYIKKQ
jgi:hypothetical protein